MGITARGIILPEELNFVVIDQCLKSLQSSTFIKRKVESYLSEFTTVHFIKKFSYPVSSEISTKRVRILPLSSIIVCTYYFTLGIYDDVQMGGNVVGCLSVRYSLKPNCGLTCKARSLLKVSMKAVNH